MYYYDDMVEREVEHRDKVMAPVLETERRWQREEARALLAEIGHLLHD